MESGGESPTLICHAVANNQNLLAEEVERGLGRNCIDGTHHRLLFCNLGYGDRNTR
jgi:hypothetical protein